MSHSRSRSRHSSQAQAYGPLFAALGDETRLRLLAALSRGQALSITQLTQGSRLTRQAITKHLRVLEGVGIVSSERAGRERTFCYHPEPLDQARKYLEAVSREWDDALGRLKRFVEE